MGRKNSKWGSNKDRRELADNMNSYIKYRDQLTSLGMSMFDWDFSKIDYEKRKMLNVRFIERTEFYKGAAVFFYDDALECYLCTPVILGGDWDVDDMPRRRTAYTRSGYHKNLDESNSVIIYNNFLRKPSCYDVNWEANRLADLEQSIDVNCKAQKTPVLILCSENERLTMENLYEQYEGNYPFIFGEKDINVKDVKSISTGAPFVADKMYQIKMQIWNEALTHLGISNISYQKKERLVSDEVIRNMGGTVASRYDRLVPRREACDAINNMFGIEISVDFREDFRQTDDENMIGDETSGFDGKPRAMVEDLRTR